MTANDIHDAIETFARYGVPRERIFNEVMRARYLDYVLFLNPENVQYGISIDDLYENMKRTADKLGKLFSGRPGGSCQNAGCHQYCNRRSDLRRAGSAERGRFDRCRYPAVIHRYARRPLRRAPAMYRQDCRRRWRAEYIATGGTQSSPGSPPPGGP